jgi:hypothetical protein
LSPQKIQAAGCAISYNHPNTQRTIDAITVIIACAKRVLDCKNVVGTRRREIVATHPLLANVINLAGKCNQRLVQRKEATELGVPFKAIPGLNSVLRLNYCEETEVAFHYRSLKLSEDFL